MGRLIQGDCLEKMKEIESGSVDMVLADPPYGTTACKWDSIIPLEPMWGQLNRVIKPNGAIVMTASQPFTSVLVMSNKKMFRYEWVWVKHHKTGHLNAKKRPMKKHENIVVFCSKQSTYNPQGLKQIKKTMQNSMSHSLRGGANKTSTVSGGLTRSPYIQKFTNYPSDVVEFNSMNGNDSHPTQKPVDLMEYLVKTYTDEGETVLDFAMGSGTTGVACKNLNRDFIGIELDEDYFKVAEERIKNTS